MAKCTKAEWMRYSIVRIERRAINTRSVLLIFYNSRRSAAGHDQSTTRPRASPLQLVGVNCQLRLFHLPSGRIGKVHSRSTNQPAVSVRPSVRQSVRRPSTRRCARRPYSVSCRNSIRPITFHLFLKHIGRAHM